MLPSTAFQERDHRGEGIHPVFVDDDVAEAEALAVFKDPLCDFGRGANQQIRTFVDFLR
ncbi:MAG TPA: hypothetical protein PJ994_02050 [Tepidiformaceae bacterium]|nr:hypothetical protein [Tepidiformaceae bacterium]